MDIKKISNNITNCLLSKRVLLYIIILTAFLGFIHHIEFLIISYFVEPFLSKFTRDPFIDFLLFGLIVTGVGFFYKQLRLSFKPSLKITFLTFLFTIIYSWYRFYSKNTWCFESTIYYPAIKYLDIIYFLGGYLILLPILNVWRIKYSDKNKLKERYKNGFVTENPITEDKLKRKDYASEIARRLLATKSGSSFALGVVGEWGSGKTSFLTLIEKEIENEVIIVKFNPWLSENSKAILRDYFDSLKVKLSEYDGNLASDIGDYSKKLTEIDDNIISKILRAATEILNPSKSIADENEIIAKSIERLPKPVVVFIDDIDRLAQTEVVEVLKLIRNTANFGNMYYVVAYDRDYVTEAISQINTHKKELYLEKIFQTEIQLPVYESDRLERELETKLLKLIDEKYHNELREIIRISFVFDVIQNLRDVYRFINGFIIPFEILKNEIEIGDLFILELIKLKYLRVYTEIYTNTQILNYVKIGQKNTDERNTILDSMKKMIVGEQEQKKFTHLFEMLCSEQKYLTNYDLALLYANKYGKSDLSIIYPSTHDRYFAFRLMDGDISQVEFGDLRKTLSRDDLTNKFGEWNKTSNISLVNLLTQNPGFDSIEDHQKLAYATFKTFISNKNRISWIIENFFDLQNKNLDNIYPDTTILGNFIEELCVENGEYPYNGEMNFLTYIKPHRNWKEIIEVATLQRYQAILLQKLIEREEKIKDMSLLTYACWSGEHKLMIDYVEKNMVDFLTTIIEQEIHFGRFDAFGVIKSFGIECVWNTKNLDNHNFDGFDEYILNEERQISPELEEFRDFWKLCKDNEYNSINFVFGHLKVKMLDRL